MTIPLLCYTGQYQYTIDESSSSKQIIGQNPKRINAQGLISIFDSQTRANSIINRVYRCPTWVLRPIACPTYVFPLLQFYSQSALARYWKLEVLLQSLVNVGTVTTSARNRDCSSQDRSCSTQRSPICLSDDGQGLKMSSNKPEYCHESKDRWLRRELIRVATSHRCRAVPSFVPPSRPALLRAKLRLDSAIGEIQSYGISLVNGQRISEFRQITPTTGGGFRC